MYMYNGELSIPMIAISICLQVLSFGMHDQIRDNARGIIHILINFLMFIINFRLTNVNFHATIKAPNTRRYPSWKR